MTHDARRELPEGTWCLRLSLERQAADEPAVQFAVFSEDPRSPFRANVRTLEQLDKAEARDTGGGRGRLLACWNRVFRTISGDRVYMLTSATENALTTNEPGGQKWVATKPVRSGTAECCWCIPFEAAVGQVTQIGFDSQNRTNLADLAEKNGGA